MELTAKDRMRELRLWSQLKDELVKQDPNFDKENVDTHQKEALPKRLLKTFQFLIKLEMLMVQKYSCTNHDSTKT